MPADLPPTASPINAQVIAYLQQLLDAQDKDSANARKLVSVVAFLEKENPRYYFAPGSTNEYLGWAHEQELSGAIPAKELVRADTALFVSYKKADGTPAAWTYVGGRHWSSSPA